MFRDRADAGRRLAAEVSRRAATDPIFADPVVLALPRGGTPVAFEVARALGAPLDLVLVRKIGAPFQPELAVGAVAEGDPPEVEANRPLMRALGMDDAAFAAALARETGELERRRVAWLGDRPRAPLEGRAAIVVDDGVATGATTRAAVRAVRRRKPAAVILATPVAPPDALDALRPEVDRILCLESPDAFYAIGAHYEDFTQVGDAEVGALLAAAAAPPKEGPA